MPTATAILGSFFRTDTPFRTNGDDMVLNKPKDGEMVFMHGCAIDFQSRGCNGRGVAGFNKRFIRAAGSQSN